MKFLNPKDGTRGKNRTRHLLEMKTPTLWSTFWGFCKWDWLFFPFMDSFSENRKLRLPSMKNFWNSWNPYFSGTATMWAQDWFLNCAREPLLIWRLLRFYVLCFSIFWRFTFPLRFNIWEKLSPMPSWGIWQDFETFRLNFEEFG